MQIREDARERCIPIHNEEDFARRALLPKFFLDSQCPRRESTVFCPNRRKWRVFRWLTTVFENVKNVTFRTIFQTSSHCLESLTVSVRSCRKGHDPFALIMGWVGLNGLIRTSNSSSILRAAWHCSVQTVRGFMSILLRWAIFQADGKVAIGNRPPLRRSS